MNSKLVRQDYYDEEFALNEQEFKGTYLNIEIIRNRIQFREN